MGHHVSQKQVVVQILIRGLIYFTSMVSCAVCGCSHRTGNRNKPASQVKFEEQNKRPMKFFRFPLSNPEKWQKWVLAIRRNNFTPCKYSRVCEIHFEKKFLKKGVRRVGCISLSPDAIPTIFPAHPPDLEKLASKT
ncbi:unnamed protein product [Bemisia tabaci]|uniref:THAP-type domain-containing protein n=2 Tax=Bemisia tabaci TaxID=7038 RepID=A0A9P0AM42_BEMTA|nr:unnamed protein product [Bemisia tabaci]